VQDSSRGWNRWAFRDGETSQYEWRGDRDLSDVVIAGSFDSEAVKERAILGIEARFELVWMSECSDQSPKEDQMCETTLVYL